MSEAVTQFDPRNLGLVRDDLHRGASCLVLHIGDLGFVRYSAYPQPRPYHLNGHRDRIDESADLNLDIGIYETADVQNRVDVPR